MSICMLKSKGDGEMISGIQLENLELKTIDVKGKKYVMVNERVKAFRSICPDGQIITEIIDKDADCVTIKASVIVDGIVLATGTAFEEKASSFINKTSYIENCETSAVGRALGFLGIGVDDSMGSADEVANAILQQSTEGFIDSIKYNAITDRCNTEGVDIIKLCGLYKVRSLKYLTEKQHSNIINNWEKVLDKCRQ